jgi:hypothetical protein
MGKKKAEAKKKASKAPKPKKVRGLKDQEVADFLTKFRERDQKDQEASPIWQELVAFPGWGMAEFKEVDTELHVLPAELPDPRMPARERAEFMESEGHVTDEGKGQPTPGAMTTGEMPGGANPWADTKEPPAGGPLFLGVNTEVKPPFPGNWVRKEGGWFREG